MIAFTLFSLVLPALVSAHGYVYSVTIDGTVYKGNPVATTPTMSSVIRQVNTNSPVKNATNPDINCGAGAQLAKDVANANPGSNLDILWVGGTNGITNWPHNVGPINAYMAKCDGSCAQYNSSNAEWFKISELGLMPGSKTTWYQSQIQSGQPTSVTIPTTLAPGNYLLRTEIIALQLAMTQGGAEFYPACIQLNVGGSQTGQPTGNEEVTFPGGYTNTDAGIWIDVYDMLGSYPFPGPNVATLAAGGGAPGSSSSTPPPPSSPPAPSAKPSSASPSAKPSASPSAKPSVSPSAKPSASPSAASPSSLATTSAPANVGASPASAAPTATAGSPSCPRKRSTTSQSSSVSPKARMHRRRFRTSH